MHKKGSWERFWETGLISDYLAYQASQKKPPLSGRDEFERNAYSDDGSDNSPNSLEG